MQAANPGHPRAHPGPVRLGPGPSTRQLAVWLLLASAGCAPLPRAQQEDTPWGQDAAGWLCSLGGAPLSGSDLLWLAGIGVVLVLLSIGAYRGLLESQVRRGQEPRVLSTTILVLALGTWLVLAFALMPKVIGVCWAGIVGGLFLLLLLLMIATGRLLAKAGVAFIAFAILVIVLVINVFK